jgi:hypothetical protein
MPRLNNDKPLPKDSATGNTGTDVGPKPPSMMPDNSQFEQADFRAVGSTPKGDSLAQRGSRGGPEMPGSTPLAGHKDVGADAAKARGNNPARSAGRRTQPADVDKLKTAGT